MATYVYRVTCVTITPALQRTVHHDYPFMSSAHHAAVQHVSSAGSGAYRHAKLDNGVGYYADDGTKSATLTCLRS